MLNPAAVRIIARSVLLEAVRRKDIYIIVVLCCSLIGVVMAVDFFGLAGLDKFYREIALKLMGTSTAIAVILLASRQLPREFEQKTIYPLLARPIGRATFLLGKGLGVGGAAVFCLALFMSVYLMGILHLGGPVGWALFLQHLYLQMLQMLLLTAACFLLSLLFSRDAALTLALLLYLAADVISHVALAIYEMSDALGQTLLTVWLYLLPQFALFDLTQKALHEEIWPPLSLGLMLVLTAYGLFYTAAYGAGAYWLFRRRAL
jgi:Cu-processing system permease protein